MLTVLRRPHPAWVDRRSAESCTRGAWPVASPAGTAGQRSASPGNPARCRAGGPRGEPREESTWQTTDLLRSPRRVFRSGSMTCRVVAWSAAIFGDSSTTSMSSASPPTRPSSQLRLRTAGSIRHRSGSSRGVGRRSETLFESSWSWTLGRPANCSAASGRRATAWTGECHSRSTPIWPATLRRRSSRP